MEVAVELNMKKKIPLSTEGWDELRHLTMIISK